MKSEKEIKEMQRVMLELAKQKGACVEGQVLIDKAGVLAWVLED